MPSLQRGTGLAGTPAPPQTQTAPKPHKRRIDVDDELVVVGSRRDSKIRATHLAFGQVFDDQEWRVEGIGTVRSIPHTSPDRAQAQSGARWRAKQAVRTEGAAFGVGIEGYIERIGGVHFGGFHVVVAHWDGTNGEASTAQIEIPQSYVRQVYEGGSLNQIIERLVIASSGPLTESDDIRNSFWSFMTGGALNRETGTYQGIALALARFKRPNQFSED